MLESKKILEKLIKHDLVFITGVPCSIFKNLLIHIDSNNDRFIHTRAASEGESVGIAAGYHLATSKVPVIYMQNSGLGNAVNPLTSLMDPEVYGLPAILFLSWRGKPGIKDEPQHIKMGKILTNLLKVLGIPYEIASGSVSKFEKQIVKLKHLALTKNQPVALIISKGIIKQEKSKFENNKFLRREEILEILLEKIGKNIVVSTTGQTSREIFEIREKNKQSHKYDFLTVGSMGCASAIGLGIAQVKKTRVHIIDGDGAVLMKMGVLTTIGHCSPSNLVHFIIDNNAYASTGGQPTNSSIVDWSSLFKSVGYKSVVMVKNKKQLNELDLNRHRLPFAVIIKSSPGARSDLGRPTKTPKQNKNSFMAYVKNKI